MKRIKRTCKLHAIGRATTLGTLLLGLLSPAYSQTTPGGKALPPSAFGANARGPEVIAQLGDKLPQVAAWYGKTAEELREILSRDASLWADKQGRLHYVCETVPAEGAVPGDFSEGMAEGLVPVDQTFKLHSRPLTTKKIYLDFNGHLTSGTWWNSSYTGGQSITTPAFDLDGNPGSFSNAELERIQYIWQRVAEDFAPFDVDVTTEDPGLEGIRKSSSTDASFGQRVCIGGSSYDWYAKNAGGVAYVGSFGGGSDTPCFVFSIQMAGGDEKFTADAISHEAGHTFGLHHDGASGTSYYQGHNNWAPIMGVGYYAEMVQWSKGEYSGANNKEDDLAMIAGYLGYSPDKVGDLMAGATPLYGSSISVDGVIEKTSDADVYSFSASAGPVSFSVTTSDRGGNLDVLLTLYDGSGRYVTSANGPGRDATLSTTIATGTYYLAIDGTGTGDPSTGYTDYASLGQYRLTGTVNSSGAVPPVAVASASTSSGTAPVTVQFSSAGSYDADGTIAAYDWDFGDGTSSSSANPSHTFSSIGTFTVTLVVRDSTGLSSPVASVTINSLAPPNQLPVAAASVSSSSGVAPLTVNFSSAGSYDPDGSIASYAWNFGTGATSTSANPSYTFSTPGTYTVTLTVTDNRGGQASRTLSITVTTDPNNTIYVGALTMTLVSTTSAKATVRVVDASGNPRPGTTVSGSWSGVVTGSATGTTDSNGNVTFTSKKVRKKGTFTFTVKNLSASGYTYDASRNVLTSNSVTTP